MIKGRSHIIYCLLGLAAITVSLRHVEKNRRPIVSFKSNIHGLSVTTGHLTESDDALYYATIYRNPGRKNANNFGRKMTRSRLPACVTSSGIECTGLLGVHLSQNAGQKNAVFRNTSDGP